MLHLYRFILLSFFLSLYQGFIFSQQVLETVYDIAAGLPFQEVTNSYKSKEGGLWLEYSNQEYLSHFDGISWKHIRYGDEGLPTGLSLLRDYKDGLWLNKRSELTNNIDLVWYDDDKKWHRHQLEGILVDDYFQVFDKLFYIDSKRRFFYFIKGRFENANMAIDNKVFTTRETLKSAIFIDSSTILFLLNHKQNATTWQRWVYYDYKQKRVMLTDSCDLAISQMLPISPYRYLVRSKNKTRVYDVIKKGDLTQKEGSYFEISKFDFMFMSQKEGITGGFFIKNNQSKKDVYVLPGKEKKLVKKFTGFKDGLRASSVCEDQNNNLWYATQSGLIRRNPHILSFSDSDKNMVNGLHALAEDEDGKIWLGGYNQGGWSVWDGKTLMRPVDKNLLYNRVLPGAFQHEGKIFFFEESFDFSTLSYIKNDRLHKLTFPEPVSAGFYMTSLRSGLMAAGLAGKGLLLFNPNGSKDYAIKNKEKGLLLQNVLTISEDQSNRLWMGRISQGVACYDPALDTVVTWLISADDPLSVGMMSSKLDLQGDLWLGTNKGLYFLTKPHFFDIKSHSVFNHISFIQLPADDRSGINSIGENAKYLLAASDKGLHLVHKTAPKDVEGRKRVYTLWFGEDIPGKGAEQNAMIIDSKGYLWLGTNEGALRMDVNSMVFDTTSTVVTVDTVYFGGSKFEGKSQTLTGPKGQRSMEFSWQARGNAHFQNNVFVSILLLNSKGDTIYVKNHTRDTKVHMAYLAPDDYRLIIKAYKNNQLGSVLEKSIAIPKLLSEHVSFWILLVIMVTSIPLLLLLNVSRSRRIRAEFELALEKAKRNQDSYRLKSLSNFFNPHFINNALHWLQSKYRKDEETAAMIDSMAGNVELLYQNIHRGVACHSLARELTLVNNYLVIQQVRFDHSLKVTFMQEMTADLNHILIPSMLLQIHVENAVEKGIRNRAGADRLLISLQDDEEEVRIAIEDDGKGRPVKVAAPEDRKGSTEVMNDLISILNAYNQNKIEVKYDDYVVDNKFGTRVTIYLPKNFNYEFEKI